MLSSITRRFIVPPTIPWRNRFIELETNKLAFAAGETVEVIVRVSKKELHSRMTQELTLQLSQKQEMYHELEQERESVMSASVGLVYDINRTDVLNKQILWSTDKDPDNDELIADAGGVIPCAVGDDAAEEPASDNSTTVEFKTSIPLPKTLLPSVEFTKYDKAKLAYELEVRLSRPGWLKFDRVAQLTIEVQRPMPLENPPIHLNDIAADGVCRVEFHAEQTAFSSHLGSIQAEVQVENLHPGRAITAIDASLIGVRSIVGDDRVMQTKEWAATSIAAVEIAPRSMSDKLPIRLDISNICKLKPSVEARAESVFRVQHFVQVVVSFEAADSNPNAGITKTTLYRVPVIIANAAEC